MGHKIPVNEDRRTIVMASGNRLDLHAVTAFDCSGTFLRLWSEEGFSLINEKSIDWITVKDEPRKDETYYGQGVYVEEEDMENFIDRLFENEPEPEYSHLTDPEALGPSPYIYEEEQPCDCPVCQAFDSLPEAEEETTDMVELMLTKAAMADTAEEALMWTQAATNVENLNFMRSQS